MGKLILCFSMILFFSFHTFFLAPAYWDEGNRMKFLLEIKMKKSYDIDPDLISLMNETKEKNQFLLKDKFKGYRKISKNNEGLKEWNIWEVFTGKNWKSLRKALKKRLHINDHMKKISGLEGIIAKIRNIEKQIIVTPDMNFRKRKTALLQLKQLQAIRNLIEIEENQVYNQLESYYIMYEKDFVETLLDDPNFSRYNHFTDADFENEDEFDEELYRQEFIELEALYDTAFDELEEFNPVEE